MSDLSPTSSQQTADVAIVMGSRSDWPTMKKAAAMLDELGIAYQAQVVSAHRTPDRLVEFSKSARAQGIKVIIAGAGGAAHLPGMVASMTSLPVLDPALAERLEAWRQAQTDSVPVTVED